MLFEILLKKAIALTETFVFLNEDGDISMTTPLRCFYSFEQLILDSIHYCVNFSFSRNINFYKLMTAQSYIAFLYISVYEKPILWKIQL